MAYGIYLLTQKETPEFDENSSVFSEQSVSSSSESRRVQLVSQ